MEKKSSRKKNKTLKNEELFRMDALNVQDRNR